MKIMKTLRSWIDSVKFWKDREDMPGVADQIRKTNMKQEQRSRQTDMQELLRMVQEGRLHEADERQLETLKLSLELNNVLGSQQPPQPQATSGVSADILEAIKATIVEQMSSGNTNYPGGAVTDPSRPDMKHTTLIDSTHAETDLKVEGDLKGDTGKSSDDAVKKRELLKKIKGG